MKADGGIEMTWLTQYTKNGKENIAEDLPK